MTTPIAAETKFARMKDLPSTHLLGAGTSMCGGCGGLMAVKQAYDVLGPKTVFVNAAGCMTLLSTYPFTTTWRSSSGFMRPRARRMSSASRTPCAPAGAEAIAV